MNKITKKICVYGFMIVVLIASYFIANEIKTEYPQLIQENGPYFQAIEVSYTNDSGNLVLITAQQNRLHTQYCSKKFNNSVLTAKTVYFDDLSIREGEPLIYQLEISLENYPDSDMVEVFSGLNQNRLRKVNMPGITKLEQFYYKNINYTAYALICYNELPGNSKITTKPDFQRPSFLDSNVLFVLSTIGIFVLLWTVFLIIIKPFPK